MSIEPQYTFDSPGNPIGAFLPIDDWNKLSKQIHLDIPQWQKELIDIHLEEYRCRPGSALDWDDVSKELDKEENSAN